MKTYTISTLIRTSLITLLAVTAIIISNLSATAREYESYNSDPITDISVSLDGQLLEFDVPPQIINDRTMVPMRAIFESLDYIVEWDGETQTIHAYNAESELSMIMQIDNNTMIVEDNSGDGSDITLDSPPVIVDGRTLVPVRAISEATGCKVEWEPDIKYVHIASLHSDNYTPAYIQADEVTLPDFYTEASCDEYGRRVVTFFIESESADYTFFIETENGEYIYINAFNSTLVETENGYLYTYDYVPFPDTCQVYCYPVSSGDATNMRIATEINWN